MLTKLKEWFMHHLLGKSQTKMPDEWWKRMADADFILLDGQVVCDHCSDQCGQCGTLRRQSQLQEEYDHASGKLMS